MPKDSAESVGGPTVVSENPKGTIRREIVPSPEAVVEGWAFGVPMPAFAEAFDLTRGPYKFVQHLSDGTKRDVSRKLWTRGDRFAFGVGDTFHTPPAPPAAWGAQLETVTHTVKVTSCEGDRVEISIHCWRDRSVEKRSLLQRELAALLKSGLSAASAYSAT